MKRTRLNIKKSIAFQIKMIFAGRSRYTLLVIAHIFIVGNTALSSEYKYLNMPGKKELNKILIKAYACSKENTIIACNQVRGLANPLIDHPKLSAVCKDLVWDLLQNAKSAKVNDLKRKNSIDFPARKMINACIKKVNPINRIPPNRNKVET